MVDMLLVAAVILCIGITVLNLVLNLGVIRRLRLHTDQLAALASAAPAPELMIGPGSRPGDFTATTVDGEQLTGDSLAGFELVGFFSPSCGSCEEWLPRFVEAGSMLAGGRRRALAVVVAETESLASDFVSKLRAGAAVVVEPEGAELAGAFKVHGFPAMCRLAEDGTVVTYQPEKVTAVPAVA